MEFHFEVSAKVETLHLDGTTKHVLQGRISFHVPGEETAGEPLNLALVFPDTAWKRVQVGDVLVFSSDQFWKGTNDEWYDSISRAVTAP